jgi:signal transduction histidine kinase
VSRASSGRAAELERRVQHLEEQINAVHAIASAFSSKINLADLMHETLRVSLETVGAEAGSIILYDPDREKLVFRYAYPESSAGLIGTEMAPDQGIAGTVFSTGEFRVIDDVTKIPEHQEEVGERVQFHTRNMVAAPLKSREGAPIGVMEVCNKHEGGFSADDCELLEILSAQATTVLENARLADEARLAAVAHALGDISHEIKNMVTPVESCAQTLEMMFEDAFSEIDGVLARAPEGDESLKQGVCGALDLLRSFYPEAIEMLLSGSAAVQERARELADAVKGIVSEPTFVWANAATVADRVTQTLKMTGEKSRVLVAAETEGKLPLAPVDPKQLYTALYNLVNNAIPETPEGGSVIVRVRALPESEFPEGGCVVIEVADTGRGMPENVRASLFTQNTISTKPMGTGLGTRIVKNVVDAHGGTIGVESEQGKGTTFTIRLPLQREGMEPPEPPSLEGR